MKIISFYGNIRDLLFFKTPSNSTLVLNLNPYTERRAAPHFLEGQLKEYPTGMKNYSSWDIISEDLKILFFRYQFSRFLYFHFSEDKNKLFNIISINVSENGVDKTSGNNVVNNHILTTTKKSLAIFSDIFSKVCNKPFSVSF